MSMIIGAFMAGMAAGILICVGVFLLLAKWDERHDETWTPKP